MNIINIEHISKLFGDKLIFDDASFGLQEGDKVGIVGINGTGKSTLLRMAAGEETPDSGQIIRQNNLKMAYLPQTPEFPKDATVLSYALSGDEEEFGQKETVIFSAIRSKIRGKPVASESFPRMIRCSSWESFINSSLPMPEIAVPTESFFNLRQL